MSDVRRVTIDPSGMFINDSEGRYAIVSWDDYGRLKDNELFGVPIYCPTCGSCGEEGCCSPDGCEMVPCLYGDKYVKSYEELLEDCDFYLHLLKKHNIDVP